MNTLQGEYASWRVCTAANNIRKEEFSVIIIGLDGAGKTTLLEKIKTLYNETPGLTPDKIGPTVGQNSAWQPRAFREGGPTGSQPAPSPSPRPSFSSGIWAGNEESGTYGIVTTMIVTPWSTL